MMHVRPCMDVTVEVYTNKQDLVWIPSFCVNCEQFAQQMSR